MDLKNIDSKIKLIPIVALVFQVLTFIFLFVGNAVRKVNAYYGISGDPTEVNVYKKSIQSAATTSFDLGGDPQVKYSGHDFWFYSFMILLIIAVLYTIFVLIKKNNIIPQKISSLIMAGIALYGMIMAIVVGTVKKVRVNDLDSIYSSSTIGQKCTHELMAVGYMFIIFSVIVIGLKVLEFLLVFKQEKTERAAVEAPMEAQNEVPEATVSQETETEEPAIDQVTELEASTEETVENTEPEVEESVENQETELEE